jgi:hypothetical protein
MGKVAVDFGAQLKVAAGMPGTMLSISARGSIPPRLLLGIRQLVARRHIPQAGRA